MGKNMPLSCCLGLPHVGFELPSSSIDPMPTTRSLGGFSGFHLSLAINTGEAMGLPQDPPPHLAHTRALLEVFKECT